MGAASISKKYDRHRTIRVRHTIGTHLSTVGVRLRAAMAAMRQSSLELTMNVYTDLGLPDVTGAMDALTDFGRTDQPMSAHHLSACIG